jgi:hypothetical protein
MKFKGVMLLFLIFVIPIVSAAIVINEFELNPPGSDGGKEWVELFNDGSSRNVSGWYVQDKDGDNYTLPNMTIGGNSFFVFDNLTGLINTDQNLKLYNNFNVLQDSTGNFSDTDNDDNTWQRVPDVNGNFTFKNETEGLPNQITEITNKTISNSCLIKDDDFSLFVNVTGFCIDEVIFSVISNGSQINFTGENSEGDNYFVDLSSSALVNNITWTVYTRNCFNTTTKNGDESFYVNNQTGLSVFPSDPDGLNGWYVTEPTFVLENGDAAMSHYRWNGDDALNYTGAFMLEDAPNDGNTTGGIHELKYWSNVSCKLENKMNETFMFDFTNPFVDDISPENGSTINNRKPTISALLDETYQSNSGIDIEIVAMSLNGVGPIVINKTPSGSLDYRIEHFPLVDLPLGQNNVSINVTDKAGRNTIFDWFFFVGDPILLAMNVYSPEDMIYSEKKVPILVK